MSADAHRLPAPIEFGRYRLLSKVAVGGMAEVYRAVIHGPAGFEKPVVVKKMLAEFARQATYRELFVAEARVMSGLSHSHILSVLDFGEQDGALFLVLEPVDGVDLAQLLMGGERLPPPLAAYIGVAVLRGLHYVHTRNDARGEPLNIVHRDVTPPNILLGRNGDVKLGDFGIAKASRITPRTAPGMLKGNVAYMSPEQAVGKPVDPRSDLYAVGLVLYEMLLGEGPFRAANQAQLLISVRDAAIPESHQLEAMAGVSMAGVIRQALRRERVERFASASEMEEALVASAPLLADAADVAARVVSVLGREVADPEPASKGASPFSQLLTEDRGEAEPKT